MASNNFQGACPMLEHDFSDITECAQYTVVQGCHGSTSCSGQTSVRYLPPYIRYISSLAIYSMLYSTLATCAQCRCEPYVCELDSFLGDLCIVPDNGPGLMVLSTCSADGGMDVCVHVKHRDAFTLHPYFHRSHHTQVLAARTLNGPSPCSCSAWTLSSQTPM
ncbi:hypothetical protein EON64_07905 [archaeon]|nr:MAG: hypothetical protein EON64_07905 [archaeon]